MDDTPESSERKHATPQTPQCDAELHVRICARRMVTGHLEYRWRVEHVDNLGQDGSSLDGRFGPFDLPHECAQEVAAVVRSFMRQTNLDVRAFVAQQGDDPEWEQLTLRDFLAD